MWSSIGVLKQLLEIIQLMSYRSIQLIQNQKNMK